MLSCNSSCEIVITLRPGKATPTLLYRLQKIRELTGVNFERGEEVLHLHLSFYMLRYDGINLDE